MPYLTRAMTDARPRRRTAARVAAARGLRVRWLSNLGLWALGLWALAACGPTEPHWQMRTAAEWGEMLWDTDPAVATTAETALKALRKRDPGAVSAALERALKTRPPKPTATPFSLAADTEGARRLGLAVPASPAEAVQLDLSVVRERIRAMRIGTATLRGTSEVDVVLTKPLDRAELLRLQARLSTRGALDLRALAHDPSRPPRGDEEKEAAAALKGEVARFVAAREAKGPYDPADGRRRAVPRAGSAAAVPADFVLVLEPAAAEDAVDERSVAAAALTLSATGAPAISVTWGDAARDRVARFAQERRGRRFVVVFDGEAVATPETPAAASPVWVLPVAEKDDPAAQERAATLAIAWPLGRLPFPLTPVPPAANYDADPAPENQVSRITASFGKLVVPMLERVSKDGPEAWTKAAAAWALDQITVRGVGAREDEESDAPKAPDAGK